MRFLGTGGITTAAVVLLAAAALLALLPLIRLFGAGGGWGGRRSRILAVIFAAHLVATLFFFPPEDIINDRPVVTLDHALHYYQAHRAREVFAEHLRCHTYDPYFMAGYPGGTVLDADSKGVEIWCALTRPLDTARAYKFFIVAGHLLLVFSIFAGSRRLGFGVEESIFGLLLLLACWHWGRPYISEFRFGGMFAYIFVIHLSFYVAGLFRSVLRGERAAWFYVVGPVAFFIHPGALVLLPVPFLALMLTERRSVPPGPARRTWDLRILRRLAAWCALVIVVNIFWIVPLVRYIDIKTPSVEFFQLEGLAGLAALMLKRGNLPALGLIALAIAGLVELARSRRIGIAAAPAWGALFLFLIAAFGIYLPLIDQLEPGRFVVPAIVFLAPLAGTGCMALIGRGAKALGILSAAGAARTAVAILLLVAAPFFGLASSRAFYRHTVGTTLTPEVKEMLQVLNDNIDRSGRLMIEDGPAWNYGDAFLVSMIPLHTGVEQIGGPYPFAFIRHNFSNFVNCRAFGKDLGGLEAERLKEYLELYNVHWIVTASGSCRDIIRAGGVAREIWSSRNFTLWEVHDRSTFTDRAGVRVEASYGRLRVVIDPVARLEEDGSVLLKYHWDRGMRVKPPARIYPNPVLDDPVPFVRLEPRGASEVEIKVR